MITIPTLVITCIIGALYDKVLSYIGILGGFCSVIIAFLAPGLVYIKTSGESYTSKRNLLTIITITILCTIGFIAGVLSIMEIFKGADTPKPSQL
jgi:hypothetical protein